MATQPRPGLKRRAPKDPTAIREEIRAEASRLGFDAVGFATAAAPAAQREALVAFTTEGRHGAMDWMADDIERRADPAKMWTQARTIVSLAMSYAPAPGEDPLAILARGDRAAISIYARGRDYHLVVKSRLKELGLWIWNRWGRELRVFVDTAPLMEKPAAARAGIGWQGRHTNLVSRAHGSWLFLGEIALSVALPADAPGEDHCGTCRACLDSCPTAAFPAPDRLDARRCLSYLTIEHPGPIPREFREKLGNRVYGCDDCLAACPWNKFAAASREAAFAPRADLAAPLLTELAALDEAGFRRRFAGTAIKRMGRGRLARNVALALGNSGEAAALPAVLRLLDDPDAVVRGAAVWALARLSPPRFAADRAARLASESDAEVRAEWDRRG
ncbi:MAG: tRNA epoxyqueuosine(34) reductase QueG [Rhodospirillales bacterium]|nr:MAG: tRNA epoxyqueuosine(34) reductase QueG [Rhodospirillales bacterium]